MADELDRLLDGIDLEVDVEDVDLDREQLKALKAISRLIRRESVKIINAIAALNGTGSDNPALLAALASIKAADAKIVDIDKEPAP